MSTILGKDSLAESSPGVALTSHTPSGSGATGGSWAAGVVNNYTAPVSLASGAGFVGVNGTATNSYLNGTSGTGFYFVECNCNYSVDTGYGGVSIADGFSGDGGQNYCFYRQPGQWAVTKDGGATTLGNPSAAFSTGVTYTLMLTREVSGSNAILTAFIDGVQVGQYTDSSSPYVGTVYGGISQYSVSCTWTDFECGLLFDNTPSITANETGFVYYGQWGSDSTGTVMQTICNGSECEFTYVDDGSGCNLCFNTAGSVSYPSIAYEVDGAQWTIAALSSTGLVSIAPAYTTLPSGSPPFASVSSNVHRVRFLSNIYSGYPSSVDNWDDLTDAVLFLGVQASALLPIPTNPNQIQFLGDSITAGLRLLYTSAELDGPTYAAPQINWTEEVSRMLGMRAVVNGHGGQGITTTGSDGAPIANSAFPYIYAGASWSPTNIPIVVWVYMGTNDSSGFTASQYQTYLSTIRIAYGPKTVIFAVVPFQCTGTRQTSIQTAVNNLADPNIVYLDYSTAFTVDTDTSDGTHFNPGGSMRMAAKAASDIQTNLTSRGIELQAAGSGTNNTLLV